MKTAHLLFALLGSASLAVHAGDNGISESQSATFKALIARYTNVAKDESFKNEGVIREPTFTAEAGREFFLKRRTWQARNFACSTCHTRNPWNEGKHMQSGIPIKPLAPAANPDRLTDAAKVESNLSLHCLDLYGRDCRGLEKGNFITYLMSIKPK